MTSATESETLPGTAIDPACKMVVDPVTAAGRSEYQGREHFFCSPSCKRKFDTNPAAYLQKSPTPAPAQPESSVRECT